MPSYILLYVVLGIPAIGLALPQLAPFIGRVSNRFVTLHTLWGEDKKSFSTMWWNGLGVFWVLSIVHCFTTMDRSQFKMYLPSLTVFLLSNFIKYQPWNLDNTKVFYNAWIPLALAAVAHFLAILAEGKLGIGLVLAVLLVPLSGLSSGYALWKATAFPNPVWDDPEPYVIANWVIEHTPPKAEWLADSRHNHPIPALAGRQVLRGYLGWMVSHNLDDQRRTEGIEELVRDPERTDIIDEFNVEYLCLSLFNSNEITFRISENSTKWKLEYSSKQYELWKRVDFESVDESPDDWND
jgi:hypothetical protein